PFRKPIQWLELQQYSHRLILSLYMYLNFAPNQNDDHPTLIPLLDTRRLCVRQPLLLPICPTSGCPLPPTGSSNRIPACWPRPKACTTPPLKGSRSWTVPPACGA